MSDDKRIPYIRTEVTWNAGRSHALLSMVVYEGDHGYLTSTCALTLSAMRTLREQVSGAIAAAELQLSTQEET